MIKIRPEWLRPFAIIPVDELTTMELVEAVRELKALADRPPKMLTDAEIETAYAPFRDGTNRPMFNGVRAVIAAHIAKQSEPDTVPFDYSLWSKGGWQAIDSAGKDVTYLAKHSDYTMKRIQP